MSGHVCRFCGAPSEVDPSDQVAPPDYCHEQDHAADGVAMATARDLGRMDPIAKVLAVAAWIRNEARGYGEGHNEIYYYANRAAALEQAAASMVVRAERALRDRALRDTVHQALLDWMGDGASGPKTMRRTADWADKWVPHLSAAIREPRR